ncbi:MAG: hypothetical protein HN929_03370 [Chloroflexi bacterium]|jgi:hypothetical protein|nr:hypothetical protein [Chloroflexota bacterium]MBT7080501.1 hypothetical protein [Chloroflexota bacterium]MBT7288940.1 hypothetical protein [Chloroflexota bacterium]
MPDDIELKPSYSTKEVSGRCIKCLAEDKYGDCLRELLQGGIDNQELRAKYAALLSLLTSPELEQLRAETELRLSEGKEVKVLIHSEKGETKYEIKTN